MTTAAEEGVHAHLFRREASQARAAACAGAAVGAAPLPVMRRPEGPRRGGGVVARLRRLGARLREERFVPAQLGRLAAERAVAAARGGVVEGIAERRHDLYLSRASARSPGRALVETTAAASARFLEKTL